MSAPTGVEQGKATRSSARRALGAWGAGFAIGLIATLVLSRIALYGYLLGAAGFLSVAVIRPRLIAAAGVLFGFMAPMVYWFWSAYERCVAMNASANSACEWGDNGSQVVLLALILMLGALLTLRGYRAR